MSGFGDISIERFLREYWQKKPCLIRRAFADFEPELDTGDVAGLACEELVESRLIHGSFEANGFADPDTPGRVVIKSDVEGEFVEGAPVGKYKVAVTVRLVITSLVGEPPLLSPKEYSTFEDTPLTIEIRVSTR